MTLTAQAQIGLGTTLSIGTLGGTPTYTPILKIKKITPPNPKWDTEEITTLDNPTAVRDFIKTLIQGGEVSIEGVNASADPGQIALYAAFLAPSNQANGAAYPFKLVLPINLAGGQTTTGDTIAFLALVTDFGQSDEEVDKVVMFKASLKITSAETYTEGS